MLTDIPLKFKINRRTILLTQKKYIMQTATVPTKTFEKILSKLDYLTEEIETIKAKLFEEEPTYGSDAWWTWSDKKADEDIKAGRVMKFDSTEEAIKWLNS